MCRFTAKFTVRKADQDTNNWLCFPSCTLCWYSATFSWCTLCWYLGRLYTLLVSWYVLLVVHFVGNLVRFPGCTLCWYLGRFCWLYTLLVILVPFPVCTLCWYPGCELGCKSTHCLFSTEISSLFLGSLEATSVIVMHLK